MKLGSWELPSGDGTMEAYLEGQRIVCKWPRVPASRRDHQYYLRHIGPVVIERARKRLNLGGRGLWLLI